MSEETKASCPKCGSDLTVVITNARRCQQCGHQFNLERNPISAAAAERRKLGVMGNWRPQK